MDSIWTKNQAKTIELILLFIPITAWNIYFCINSYLLVNYRAEEIKERQWIPYFYGYFFDIFFLFWLNLFKNISFELKQIKKIKKANKKNNKDLEHGENIQKDEIK